MKPHPGLRTLIGVSLATLLASCGGVPEPPSDIANACSIATERQGWYQAARKAARKWQVPTPVILAIVWRESSFRSDARTPREYALGVIPWGRQSSAFGFAQAIDGTWEWYQRDHGGPDADRENFSDAVDFVGWYMDRTRRELGFAGHEARKQYLAYHEGHNGYRKGDWREKQFLLRASAEVERMARRYHEQLRGCDSAYAREARFSRMPNPRQAPFALRSVAAHLPQARPAPKRIVAASVRDRHP